MKRTKKLIGVGAFVFFILLISTTVFAVSKYNSPAEAVAGLTGRSVDSVVQERRDTEKTYGTIAKEAGKLEEFKEEKIEVRKASLAKKVADGKITEEKANEYLETINERMQNCDGNPGEKQHEKSLGLKFGSSEKGVGKMLNNGEGRNKADKTTGFGNRQQGLRLQNCFENIDNNE